MSASPDVPPHRYHADRPLESIADDQLERAGFAERLAADITGWHGNDSLVVSLNGEWGSGKTTLKNFIRQKLIARGDPILVEFNPWAWSGQEKLVEGFFTSLHGRFREANTPDFLVLAERWEALERWTKAGAEVSDQVSKALTPLFGGSVIVVLLSNSATNPYLQLGGVSLGLLGVIVTSFLAAFPGLAAPVAAYFRRKAGKAALSLSDLRRRITADLNRLREAKRPVVVIIDDIDRLNAEEIRLVFQLVKVNGDFPNLVYLLLFQASIVTKALAAITADSGEEYLKKIVQVPMEVPQASRPLMQAILLKGLNQIVDDEKVKIRWDRQRFLDLFEDYLWPYFKTLRDVKRFLGTFDFYFHGQVENGVLQVNPVDLLAVEVLRTFDHDAYLGLRDSLGFNLPKKFMRLLVGDKERRKEITVERDAIVNQPGRDDAGKARLKVILSALFPDEFSSEERTRAERDLRVCHPDHFPRYFEHSLDRTVTSAAAIHDIFARMGDRQRFAGRLRELIASKEIEAVFGKLGLYFEEVPAASRESFIGGLFDAGDGLPDASLSLFNRDPYVMAGRMVVALLGKLPDSASRAALLQRALTTTSGLLVPTVSMGILTHFLEKKSPEAPVTAADLAPLRDLVLSRVKACATSGAIWQNDHFALYLYRWRDWAGQADVNVWLAAVLTTPALQADFLGRMTQRSVINGTRLEHYLDGVLLETFVNLEELSAAVAAIPDEDLTEHQRRARRLLQRAVKLKSEGRGYAEVREGGDFDPDPEA